MTTPRLLQRATHETAPALIRLVRAFYAHFGYPFSEPEKQRLLARVLDTPSIGSLWLVQPPAGDAVGYLFLSYYFSLEFGGPTAFIDELFIEPSHRGRGLGSQALIEVAEIARDLGIAAVQLEVERTNPRAASLYLRLGFVDCDRHLLTRVIAPRNGPGKG